MYSSLSLKPHIIKYIIRMRIIWIYYLR